MPLRVVILNAELYNYLIHQEQYYNTFLANLPLCNSALNYLHIIHKLGVLHVCRCTGQNLATF